MNKFFLSAVSTVLLFGSVSALDVTNNPPEGLPRALNNAPATPYGQSRVETKLNVNIQEGTQKVHFIRDNSDPYIVSKAYVIKNADPFILRGVLKTIVAGSLASDPVSIESISYNDGQAVLLVSAEEYRFKNAVNGMSMDQLIESLDKKGLPNSSGTVDMAYFPKYNSAETLLTMMVESGIGFTGAAQAVHIAANSEYTNAVSFLGNGMHVSAFAYGEVDPKMNAIILTAPGFDMAEAMNFLKEVDTPKKQIRLSYKLVEVYAENDQKLGLDFQAWKNNDGIDLFSAGGKYGTNWASGLTPNNGYTYAEYYNFNPKWNTKYVDFLTVCGKAKIVSNGTLVVGDDGVANLTLTDGLFSIVTKDIKNSVSTPKKTVSTTTTDGNTTTTTTEEYAPATDSIPWTLEALLPSPAAEGYYSSRLAEIPMEALNHNVRQGKTQEVEAGEGNLFQLSVAGDVHTNASNLDIALSSTSLIGWDGQGKARLTNSFYQTKIQIGADKKEFVIGGLTKTSVVRSVAGLPFLKDIPVLGWAFSTETDTVKKSQFVLIATAEVFTPATTMTDADKAELDGISKAVEKADQCPAGTLGFQQLLLDTPIK